jgi:hypothetical protein|tara:strand:- start:12079 stop:12495 length:417 start_codon:yes stop_codon:yes gene_type:complete
MSKPRSFGANDVQSWVRSELKYSGEKAVIADLATEKALEWWVRTGDFKYGIGLAAPVLKKSAVARWRKDARKECKSYIKANAKRYGFIWGFLLSVLIQIVISAVAKIIVDWLFSDKEPRVYFSEQAAAYRSSMNADEG